MQFRRAVLRHGALVLFGLVVGVALLEVGLRAAAWFLLRSRTLGTVASTHQRGVVRILCLGESTTFDMQLSGKNSYPKQLETILNTSPRRRRIAHVINGGVAATSTDRIVRNLDANLDKHQPDIVVTMMGINDGLADDPFFPVYESLRVVKVARLLIAAVWAKSLGENPIADVARTDRDFIATGVPQATMLMFHRATTDMFDGRFDEAERTLLRLAHPTGYDEIVTNAIARNATEKLLLLSLQRGRLDDAERYRRQRDALTAGYRNVRTATNYAKLVRTIEARKLTLVAVQYPGHSLTPLRDMLPASERIVFVDNEATFLDAVKTRPLKTLYRDLFNGMVGHMTAEGNALLARNVATAILEIMNADPTDGR